MLDFEAVRFGHERELEDSLLEGYCLDPLLEHFEQEGGLEEIRNLYLANAIRITPLLSPRLHGILEDVLSRSGLEIGMELFVTPSAEVNAFTMQATGADELSVIILTSKLVEMMSDDELRFVIGHELAHNIYGHYRIMQVEYAVPKDNDEKPQIPALLNCKLQSLGRLCEISADRVGYMLSDASLDTAVSVFFKMASGLDKIHLRFDIKAFLDQLDDILTLSKKDYFSKMSHPAHPIRVKALQLLDDRLLGGTGIRDRETLDQEIYALTHIMEYEVTESSDVAARDFLMAGGVLAASLDGAEITSEMYDHLVELVIPFSSDPESHFIELSDARQTEKTFKKACSWLKKNSGEEKFLLFRLLLSVVGLDGKLTKTEEEFMQSAANAIGIPQLACSNLMHEVRTMMLKAQRPTSSIPSFNE